jgi:hypothetical protein
MTEDNLAALAGDLGTNDERSWKNEEQRAKLLGRRMTRTWRPGCSLQSMIMKMQRLEQLLIDILTLTGVAIIDTDRDHNSRGSIILK